MNIYIAIATHYSWDSSAVEVFTTHEEAKDWLEKQREWIGEINDPDFFNGEIRHKYIDVGVKDEALA